MKYYLYILKSKSVDKYYIGISQNPDRRLEYHNTIEKGFTARYRPWTIVFTKEFETKELALQAERRLKKWKSKKLTEKIVSGELKL